jgi:Zn-dependent peptidase ImmA (M78 family)/transcriptional regulator with XRE-family HTH domain
LSKNILNRIDRNLARRLREARREVGLSTRAVAKELPRRLAVSHVTIAAYENGTTTPPIDVLAAIADLYRRPLNWFLENRETLEGFRYRNMSSRIRLSDQRQFEALACKWADAYFKLSQHLNGSSARPRQIAPPQDDQPPDVLATCIRSLVGLDDKQPIHSVVSLLESFSTWALELRAIFGIESAAARHGADFVVVLNPDATNDRVRMTAAYELAHVLYQPAKPENAAFEMKAYEFASSLLIPNSQLREAFEGKSFIKLVTYKEKFGISLSAMIYMAEKSRIINTTTSRWLWREMGKHGWRQCEPGLVWRDRAITFETMLECAIQSSMMTWADAERVTGIKEYELRARLLAAVGAEAPLTDTPEAAESPPIIGFAPKRLVDQTSTAPPVSPRAERLVRP